MPPQDLAALDALGIGEDLRVEGWFSPSDYGEDGCWEQGVAARIAWVAGKQRALFVAYPVEGRWTEWTTRPILLDGSSRGWRPGWSREVPLGLDAAEEQPEEPEQPAAEEDACARGGRKRRQPARWSDDPSATTAGGDAPKPKQLRRAADTEPAKPAQSHTPRAAKPSSRPKAEGPSAASLELIEEVREFMKVNRVSQVIAGQEARVSQSVISQWLSLRYHGHNDKVRRPFNALSLRMER